MMGKVVSVIIVVGMSVMMMAVMVHGATLDIAHKHTKKTKF